METEKITKPMEQANQVAPQISTPAPLSQEQIQREIERLYPNRQFATPEELIKALIDDQISAKERVSQMESANKQIFEMIEANPVLSDVIEALGNGEPFEIALAKNVDLEALAPIEGEDNYETYRKTVNERKMRKAEIAKTRESFEANQVKSKADADEFFTQNKMSEEEQTAFVDFVENFINDLFRGEVSKETLKKMYQAFRYDEAVSEAAEQGQVEGRNTAIEVKRTKTTATDGLPNPGSAVAVEPEQKQKKQIFKI